MAFQEPLFSNGEVDQAGDYLIGYPGAFDFFVDMDPDPMSVVDNWRSCHAFPLNTFQMTLRHRARKIDPSALVAQRIKRLASIQAKLEHPRAVKLSEIQDIAGCRAILSSVAQVQALTEGYRLSYRGHELADMADYIRSPKRTGYRGIHLIYRYADPKHPEFGGLKVEMQFRTNLQHAWATAVETTSLMTGQNLKADQGDADWSRFFALMGSAIAVREGCRRVPHTPREAGEMVSELGALAAKLTVVHRLRAFSEAINITQLEQVKRERFKYVIIVLDLAAQETRFIAYPPRSLLTATARYAEMERHRTVGQDAVLVSVADAASLQRAYPNYFGDTRLFVDTLLEVTA